MQWTTISHFLANCCCDWVIFEIYIGCYFSCHIGWCRICHWNYVLLEKKKKKKSPGFQQIVRRSVILNSFHIFHWIVSQNIGPFHLNLVHALRWDDYSQLSFFLSPRCNRRLSSAWLSWYHGIRRIIIDWHIVSDPLHSHAGVIVARSLGIRDGNGHIPRLIFSLSNSKF